MSRFSGKYDIYDCMELDGSFDEFKRRRNGKIYQIADGKETEIKINNYKDIIKYFPYVPIDEYWVNGYQHTVVGNKSYIDIMKKENANMSIVEQFESEIENEYMNADKCYYIYHITDNMNILLCKHNNESECLDCISDFLRKHRVYTNARKHKYEIDRLWTTVVNKNELLVDDEDDMYHFKIVIKTI